MAGQFLLLPHGVSYCGYFSHLQIGDMEEEVGLEEEEERKWGKRRWKRREKEEEAEEEGRRKRRREEEGDSRND